MKEPDFKTKFQQQIKKNLKPTAILQYKQDATTVKGFPDTIILGAESVTVFIEFKKSKRAKFRPGQKEWGEKLNERNFLYYCVCPENADDVYKELETILKF